MPRVVQTLRFGGPDVLAATDVPSAQLGAGEARIRVHAAGVNFGDIVMRMGMYPKTPKLPFVLGGEVAGEVIEAGAGAVSLRVGERVVAWTGYRFGGYATEVCLPASYVVPLPASLSWEQGAAIPVNWLTAWTALEEMARVREGDRVLVDSAAGGVGIAAVQIARHAGAKVVGLVGTSAKAARVTDLGASEVWTNDQWQDPAWRPDERFDVVLNSTGGRSLSVAFDRLSRAGRLVFYGVSSVVGPRRSMLRTIRTMRATPTFRPFQLMDESKGVFGLDLTALQQEQPERLGGFLTKILAGFSSGAYRTIVGKTFALDEAASAHDHLLSRQNVGKVVLTSPVVT